MNAFEQFLLVVMYTAVALYFAPWLTVLAVVSLGGTILLIRYGLEPAFVVGDRVARSSEDIQRSAQAGIQGIRAVTLFGTGYRPTGRYFSSAAVSRRNPDEVDSVAPLTHPLVVDVDPPVSRNGHGVLGTLESERPTVGVVVRQLLKGRRVDAVLEHGLYLRGIDSPDVGDGTDHVEEQLVGHLPTGQGPLPQAFRCNLRHYLGRVTDCPQTCVYRKR